MEESIEFDDLFLSRNFIFIIRRTAVNRINWHCMRIKCKANDYHGQKMSMNRILDTEFRHKIWILKLKDLWKR